MYISGVRIERLILEIGGQGQGLGGGAEVTTKVQRR